MSRSLLVGIGLTLAALLAVSAPALAAVERLETGVSFGPQGTGAGSFERPASIAIDQKDGDVFVYDSNGSGHIYKFDAAGEPVGFSSLGSNEISETGTGSQGESQVAVDESGGPDSGDIYLANASVVRIYAESGSYLGELSGGRMCGVGVDASGNVYVGGWEKVTKYVPTSNPVTNSQQSSSLKGAEGTCNVGLDGEGNLYAANYYGGIGRFEALQFGSPFATSTPIDTFGNTLAVDRSSGGVFVNESEDVAEYDSTGELMGKSAMGKIFESHGVAFDDANDQLYVPGARTESRVKIFGAPILLPSVSGLTAYEVKAKSATLKAMVNPEGTATTYQFQYGTSEAYGSSIPASPESVGSDSANHELSANLAGLQSNTEYYYRLLATNSNGTVSSEGTFTTGGSPTVINGIGSSPTQSTMNVEAYLESKGFDTSYQVEYGTTEAYGSITEPVDVGIKTGWVGRMLTGLQVDTTYHFRFVAVNAEGTSYGPDRTYATTPVARLGEESISEAGNTEVTLKSVVEDFGTAGTYYFEYGPTSEYGSSTREEALSAELEGPLNVQARLVGLSPNSKYFFRLVVKNKYGVVRGSEYAFSTSPIPSLALPDGRIYEKVSPNENAKGNVIPPAPFGEVSSEGEWSNQPNVAAANGNTGVYMADPSEVGGTGREGGGAGNQYLARRTGNAGWSAVNIEPESGEINDRPGYQAFTKDLESGFLTSNGEEPLVAGAPGSLYNGLYRRDLASMAFEPLFTVVPPNRTAQEFGSHSMPVAPDEPVGPVYAGSSTDLSHMFFAANDALTPNAIDGGRRADNLYESHGGELTLVNVLPDGSTEPNATFGGPVLPGESTSVDGPALTHAISEDGHRVYWTDLKNGNLYLRENGQTTVQVDASVGGHGAFRTATPDGSRALFVKGGDIYEYDATEGRVTDLTPGAEVQGIVSTSEDLSYVYFVADAALAPGAKAQACEAEEWQTSCNLYVLHQGEPVRFIAALSPLDNETEAEVGTSGEGLAGDWQTGQGEKQAEATPSGRSLVFISSRSLTGYDNVGYTGAANKNDEEVFVYDYEGSKLFCASCNPTGEKPLDGLSAYLSPSMIDSYSHRWISSDGTKVFFDSKDPLVPQDTNGLMDVYEWEQDGSGTCEVTQGCIYLLSAGTSPERSFLVDASENGNDVFFTTRSQLVPEDQNENIDLYDVRADAPQPVTPPQCTGSGCQGVPLAPPVFATPSSVTYDGVGNFPPPTNTVVKGKNSKAGKKSEKAKKPRKKRTKKHKGVTHKSKKSARKSGTSHGGSK